MPMLPLVRRAAVVTGAGALVAGLAVYGSAQAEEPPAEPPATSQATLREAAEAAGKFVGTAVADDRLSDATYSGIASTEFNSVTAENVMKWDTVQPSQGSFSFEAGDRLVDFANQNGQQVYGHTLVWHSQLPSWVSDGGFSADELNSVMTDHITEVAGHYAGQVAYWDVVNEAFEEDGSRRQSVFQTTIGDEYIANAFRAADAADPDAKLCINDYNIEGVNAKSDALYDLVSSLLEQGVPIDCVGFQSHLTLGGIPGDMQENLQRFADLGLEVIITELDIRMTTPPDDARLAQQGEEYRQVVEACVNVAGCTGVTVWGFSDADSWVPEVFPGEGAACPYDENYQPKPAYDGILAGFGG
jgi:endo-1,4-beta-xylanase